MCLTLGVDSRVHALVMGVPGRIYRIGKLAAQSGLTRDALRFYERLGLFPKLSRSRGGFRLFAADTFDRLQFIKRAQVLGFTLDEIRELVSFNGQGGLRRCRSTPMIRCVVWSLLRAKLSSRRS